jgi:cytochrome c553
MQGFRHAWNVTARQRSTSIRVFRKPATYIVNRLRNWRKGITSPSATDPIMAPIARSLNEQQIDDVAAYFASTSPAVSKEENQ